jgi:peptidyl-prolyl cis-trans isomerase SDCCAG10
MEAEIRKLQRRRDDDSDNEDETSKKKAKKSYLNEELVKYAKGKGIHKKGKKKDEGDVLAALSSFRGKLQQQQQQSSMIVDEPELDNNDDDDVGAAAGGDNNGGGDVEDGEEEMEVDNDTGFMTHALHFPKDNAEETMKAERDYEVIDPRERGAKAKEEERQRKKAVLKAKGGHVSGGRYRR